MGSLMPGVEIVLALVAGAGSLFLGGFYYAFSNSVIEGLDSLEPDHGAAAMVRINELVPRSLFLPLFFLTAISALGAAAADLTLHGDTISLLIGAGSALHLLASFLSTIIRNVPLNNALARASEQDRGRVWATYRRDWLRWNNLRVAASLAGGMLLLCGTLARLL